MYEYKVLSLFDASVPKILTSSDGMKYYEWDRFEVKKILVKAMD
jgi:hypothetical protein